MHEKMTLENLYSVLQKKMLDTADLSTLLQHPTDKGDNAEDCWISWFNEYLPKRYRVSKATVIDCNGDTSHQIDIVIYDGQYSYMALKEGERLYIPAESVYAVFEVKQELNKRNLNDAAKQAGSVRKLYRTSVAIPYAGGFYNPKPLHQIIAGILATRSGWKPAYGDPFKNEIKAYKNNNNKRIDCGCVLDAGSFYYDYENSLLMTSNESESLVSFFFQLLSMLQKIATVPAIDFAEYRRSININKEKLD